MTWLRRRLLHLARPRTFDELIELLPAAAFEEVGVRGEIVVYTGWDYATEGPLLPMLTEEEVDNLGPDS